jgi:O-acetyl-ADP-ribose deacetylase (regulator of RNase III)
MIQAIAGNIFDSHAQTLVSAVNCAGVMGKGIALEFKKRFPAMYEDYRERCAREQVRLGQPYLHLRPSPPHIVIFPTKSHWRSVSRLEDIVAGLKYMQQRYQEWGITSLAVPALGCGEGGLEWQVVGPILYHHLAQLAIPVELYAPVGVTSTELATMFPR